ILHEDGPVVLADVLARVGLLPGLAGVLAWTAAELAPSDGERVLELRVIDVGEADGDAWITCELLLDEGLDDGANRIHATDAIVEALSTGLADRARTRVARRACDELQ